MTEFPDWLRGTVLLGKHNGEYVAVKVEEDGDLNVLLRGEYEGALRTVKLDDEGRMSAFVIDSTDAWGRMLSIGNAELAARLGSIVCADRRGQVVFLESFANGLSPWVPFGGGTGAAVALDPTSYMSSGYSVKLTGGSDDTRVAWIIHRRQLTPLGGVGVSGHVAVPSDIVYFTVFLRIATGTHLYVVALQLDYAALDLRIYNSSAGWTKIGDVKVLYPGAQVYNWWKIVGDLLGERYIRAMWNDVEFDIGSHALYAQASSAKPCLYVNLEVCSRAGYNDSVYVDNIVVTVAES